MVIFCSCPQKDLIRKNFEVGFVSFCCCPYLATANFPNFNSRVGSDEGERIHAAEDKERRPKYREDQAYHDRMRPRYNSYLDQEDEYEKRKRREQEENREESEEKQRKKGHGRSASRTPHHSTQKKINSASAFTPREATLKDVSAYKKMMEGKKDKVEISENNRLEYWDPSEDPFFVIFGYIFDLQNGMKYIFNLASTHRQSEAMSNMVGDVWTHQQSEAMSNMVGDVWTQFILLQSRLTRSWEYLQWNDLDLPLSWRSREVEKHLHKIKKHLYKGDRILQKGREKIVTANEKAKPKNYDKEVFLFHLLGDEAFMKISTTTSIWHKVFVDKYSKALKIECKGKADGVA